MWRSRGDLDREVDEEIRFHVEMRTEANVAAGMDEKTARRDAERRFGDQRRVRQAGREILGADLPGGRPHGFGPWLEGWFHDVRIGFRSLANNRIAAAAAILSLGLGIGANTANFSTVYGVLFRQLPFEDGDRLLFIDAWNPDRGDGDRPLTWADLTTLRGFDVFTGLEAYDERSFTVTGSDHPERVAGGSVTPGMFDLLGVEPQIGRNFRADEGAQAGFEPVAILSDALWRRMYAGEESAIGDTIHLNGRELVIVGVMPAGFRFPQTEDLWVPLGTDDPTNHESRSLTVVGKLADGATLDAARAQLAVWTEQAANEFPRTHQGWDVRAQWFRHGFVDAAGRQSLYLLLAAVGFVLLLACANVANLLLARATDLHRDLVVRSALGADRWRLARQVLTESVLLGVAGGAIGIGIAWVWVRIMARSIPEELAYWIEFGIDGPVLLYALTISVGTGLVFGLLPAMQASRAGFESINAGGRGVLGGGRGRMRSALVIAEVALSVVLLASAALMVQSFFELQVADPGFDEEQLLSLRIIQAGDQYDPNDAKARYYREVSDRLSVLPGVESAAVTGAIPADDGSAPISILPEGAGEGEEFYATAVVSGHGLLRTLGIEPIDGRDFTAEEAFTEGSDVALVGASLAARLWPDGGAVGRVVNMPDAGMFRVIGVVSDLQYEEFGEEGESTRLQLHLPYARAYWRNMSILVRATADPASLTAAVRDELATLDPTLAPYDIMTMIERRAYTIWPQRVFGQSFAAFGVIALVLALCGIYGVIAYSVVRQTREIGVRIALGARPGDVVRRVVGRALGLSAVGATIGLVGALAFARALEGVLFGVSINDPTPYAAVAAVIITAAILASFTPARRAAGVDPTDALRAD